VPFPPTSRAKSKQELIELLCSGLEPGSIIELQARSALDVLIAADAERATMALEKATRDAAASSDSLGQKVFWLNVILAAATIVGTLSAVWVAFR
jgi:hypothetical protein